MNKQTSGRAEGVQPGKFEQVVILSDGRAGHLNQSRGIAGRLPAEETTVIPIEFKNRLRDLMCRTAAVLARALPALGRSRSWARLVLRLTLSERSLEELGATNPQVVISTGSGMAGPNLFFSRLRGARSVVSMVPSMIGTRPFDLAAVPEYEDHPPAENIVTTTGVPNTVTPETTARSAAEWMQKQDQNFRTLKRPLTGILLGGTSRHFELRGETLEAVLSGLEDFQGSVGGGTIITTSRRTPEGIEGRLRSFLRGREERVCLIPAGACGENPVPMMLDLCDLILVTDDSISMVSEAASGSGRVLVVGIDRKKKRLPRHFRLLAILEKHGYIRYIKRGYLEGRRLALEMEGLLNRPTATRRLDDAGRVAGEMVERFLKTGSGDTGAELRRTRGSVNAGKNA